MAMTALCECSTQAQFMFTHRRLRHFFTRDAYIEFLKSRMPLHSSECDSDCVVCINEYNHNYSKMALCRRIFDFETFQLCTLMVLTILRDGNDHGFVEYGNFIRNRHGLVGMKVCVYIMYTIMLNNEQGGGEVEPGTQLKMYSTMQFLWPDAFVESTSRN